jgi:hypothetical protein
MQRFPHFETTSPDCLFSRESVWAVFILSPSARRHCSLQVNEFSPLTLNNPPLGVHLLPMVATNSVAIHAAVTIIIAPSTHT